MTSKAKYRVANPRKIDSKVRVFCSINPDNPDDVREWYEGDQFTAPPWYKAEDTKDLVAKGFLEVV